MATYLTMRDIKWKTTWPKEAYFSMIIPKLTMVFKIKNQGYTFPTIYLK